MQDHLLMDQLLISASLLVVEIKHFGKNKNKDITLSNNEKAKETLKDKITITISREYGSGGRYIGQLVADKLGIKLYDKEFVEKLAVETGLTEEYIENNEQKRNALDALNSGYYFGMNNSDELFIKESELIKEIANKESCVIIGRCADFILKDNSNVIKVFVYSNMEDEVKRATKFYGQMKKMLKKK